MEYKTYAFVGTASAWLGFIIIAEIITVVVGNFLARLNVPDGDDPNLSTDHIRLRVWIARVIDMPGGIIGHVAVDRILVVELKHIDSAVSLIAVMNSLGHIKPAPSLLIGNLLPYVFNN